MNNSWPFIESGGHSVSRGRDWILECCRRIGDYKGETENRPRQNTTRGQVNHHILSKLEADFNQGYIFFPTNPRGVCYKFKIFGKKYYLGLKKNAWRSPLFHIFPRAIESHWRHLFPLYITINPVLNRKLNYFFNVVLRDISWKKYYN